MRDRGERGSVSVELVLLTPVLVVIFAQIGRAHV